MTMFIVELTEIISQIGHVTLEEIEAGAFLVRYLDTNSQVAVSPLFLNWDEALANFARRVEEEDHR